MKRKSPAQTTSRGRPRSFDVDLALDKALQLFWTKGYEATSISDLTEAMGINPPSLYAAFGDKQALFLQVARRYVSHFGNQGKEILQSQATARQGISKLLEEMAIELTNNSHPRGCLLVLAAGNCATQSPVLESAVAELRGQMKEEIKLRIEKGIDQGELRGDAEALAAFYMSVLHGMSIQSRDGASRDCLRATARLAMNAWPARTNQT